MKRYALLIKAPDDYDISGFEKKIKETGKKRELKSKCIDA